MTTIEVSLQVLESIHELAARPFVLHISRGDISSELVPHKLVQNVALHFAPLKEVHLLASWSVKHITTCSCAELLELRPWRSLQDSVGSEILNNY